MALEIPSASFREPILHLLVVAPRAPQRLDAPRHNPEHHNRTKHVERRHFFIRDMVEKFELRVPLVSTVNNYADFFTKPLKSKAFFGLRNKIMNIA